MTKEEKRILIYTLVDDLSKVLGYEILLESILMKLDDDKVLSILNSISGYKRYEKAK